MICLCVRAGAAVVLQGSNGSVRWIRWNTSIG